MQVLWKGQLMLISICALSSLRSLSQTPGSASLEGHVRDPVNAAWLEMGLNCLQGESVHESLPFITLVPCPSHQRTRVEPEDLERVWDTGKLWCAEPIPLPSLTHSGPTNLNRTVWCEQEINAYDGKALRCGGYYSCYPTQNNTTLHYKKLISTKN